MRTLATIVLVAFSFVSFTPRVQAQTHTQHTASQSALDAAVQQHVASSDAQRQAVLRLLDRPEVQQVAGEAGLDLKTAKAAVATLQGDQLAAVAAQASQVEQSLAGGQSRIVISTTLIIVALLVLILIIVAVD